MNAGFKNSKHLVFDGEIDESVLGFIFHMSPFRNHLSFKLVPVATVLYMKLLPYYLEFLNIFDILRHYYEAYKEEKGLSKQLVWYALLSPVQPSFKGCKERAYVFPNYLPLAKRTFEMFGSVIPMHPPIDKCCYLQYSILQQEDDGVPWYSKEQYLGLVWLHVSILVILNFMLRCKDPEATVEFYPDPECYMTFQYIKEPTKTIIGLLVDFGIQSVASMMKEAKQ